MPRNIIGASPYPVQVIDTDTPLDAVQLLSCLGDAPGVSLCVRSAQGPQRRGGYFFHFARAGEQFLLSDFENNPVGPLEPTELVRFINHVSGRLFDPEMLHFCQSVVNFRQDQTTDDLEV